MYEDMADQFKALADPVRLHILSLLRVREACVCELVSLLPLSQPAISQHLRKLRQTGWVRERRHKYWTYYGIHPELPSTLRAVLETLPHNAAEEQWLRSHHVEISCQESSVADEPSQPSHAMLDTIPHR